jgi:uncharacterized membrane protein
LELVSKEVGYFQSYNPEKLSQYLGQKGLINICVHPGNYLQRDVTYAEFLSATPLTQKQKAKLESCFSIGYERTHVQDVRYGIRQLVDIALRALSPGINDPTTAVEALNAIGSIVILYVESMNVPEVIELKKDIFLKAPQVEKAETLHLAFDQILRFSKDHELVLLKIHEILEALSQNSVPAELNQYIQYLSKRISAYLNNLASD